MTKKKYSFNLPFSLIFGLISLFVLVIIITFNGNSQEPKALSTQASKTPDEIKVFNKTKSFQIVSAETSGEAVNILLKNNYRKSINSFYLSTGTKQYHAELIYSGIKNEILPNEEYSFSFPIDEKVFSVEITLLAVLFVDETSDGESSSIKEMKDKRFGEKIQLIQGLEWLRQAKEVSSSNIFSEVSNLKLKILSLPDKDNKKSTAVNSGLHFGKQRLLRYVQEILISNKPSSTSGLQKEVFADNSGRISNEETQQLSETEVRARISELEAKLEKIITLL